MECFCSQNSLINCKNKSQYDLMLFNATSFIYLFNFNFFYYFLIIKIIIIIIIIIKNLLFYLLI